MSSVLRSPRRFGIAAYASAGLLSALPGCSTATFSSPFSSSPSISETDRVFLSAAGTWDRNHDGIITCDEWKAYAGELFDAADANHDGFVDRTEWATIVQTDRMFATVDLGYYDANGDGRALARGVCR